MKTHTKRRVNRYLTVKVTTINYKVSDTSNGLNLGDYVTTSIKESNNTIESGMELKERHQLYEDQNRSIMRNLFFLK